MHFTNPAEAEAAFYTAFRDLDIDGMRQVWLASEGTSCIHPGGDLLQGIEAILASWTSIFGDNQPPHVDHRLIQASANGNLAVHTVEESIRSHDGETHAVVLATNVYGMVEGGWRMLAHHASLPLVDTSRESKRRTPLH